jgi:hypothetical protein
MAAKWIRVEKDLINPDYVALVEYHGDTVTLHLALPEPAIPDGIGYPIEASPPLGTGHVIKDYNLHVWESALKAASLAT